MVDPTAQGAVLRVVVIDERGIGAGFADQGVFGGFAVAVETQAGFAGLVGVEAVDQAFGVRVADQAGEVVEEEPGLVVDQDGAEDTAVAEEVLEGRGGVVHAGSLCRGIRGRSPPVTKLPRSALRGAAIPDSPVAVRCGERIGELEVGQAPGF